jgi:primosomal replication protein N
LTISVMPADHLPYRPLEGARVEAFFDARAELGSGPDPPPAELEAGCLRRAWTRFQTRVSTLKEAFGLLIPSVISGPAHLWKQMRLAKGSLAAILGFLAQNCKISLLGDYRCLKVPP